MNLKKENERYTIEKFVSHKDLELSINNIEDSEKPDFIVNISNKTISVELTQLINSRQKQIESFRKKIIKNAEKQFIERFNTSFRVWITFSKFPMNTKEHDKQYFETLIFNTVEEIYLNNKNRDFTVKTKIGDSENKYIDCIHVTTNSSPYWESSGVYLIEYADLNWIQSIVNKKSNLINQYKNSFDEHWLIMEASIGDKSSGYRFDHIINKLNKKKFDRVFIFERFPNEIIEIK